MVAFDPENPFPLLEIREYSYTDAKLHSQAVDQWLGLDTNLIENQINKDFSKSTQIFTEKQIRITPAPRLDHWETTPVSWSHLPVHVHQTPYLELRLILDLVQPQKGEVIVDLGAGYFRLGHVTGRHYPNNPCWGIEVIPERVQAARTALERFNYKNVELILGDAVHDFSKIPPGRIYFIYDFGDRSSLEAALQQIQSHATKGPICLVGRGRAIRDLVEHQNPWLSQVVPPRHFSNFSIYYSQERHV